MQSRRFFLRMVGMGALASSAPLVISCGGPKTGQAEASGRFSGGNVKDLKPGQPRVLSTQPVAVILDDQGVYAMSLICTHAACDMRDNGSVGANEITCTCHGSAFDVDGNPIAGPAGSPLKHYLVTIDAQGAITVDADQVVGTDTRAPAS
jgi:cytochrome b6-f complex iron-sulfur subunit